MNVCTCATPRPLWGLDEHVCDRCHNLIVEHPATPPAVSDAPTAGEVSSSSPADSSPWEMDP